eukprot:4046616-Ditylum_brightwellii.AAC.1
MDPSASIIPQKINLSLVCLTHCSSACLETCLEQLTETTPPEATIYVDNSAAVHTNNANHSRGTPTEEERTQSENRMG